MNVVSLRSLQYEQQYKAFYGNGGVNLKNDIIYINRKGWSQRKYAKELMKMRTRAVNNK